MCGITGFIDNRSKKEKRFNKNIQVETKKSKS